VKATLYDVYGPPEVLRLGEVERPVAGANQVLVRVRAAGVDQGVWHLVAGLPYLVRLMFGWRGPRNPVPGSDLAGEVEAVGGNVTRFKPGDAVFGAGVGTFAEYALASEDMLLPKPSVLGFEEAAAVPVSGVTALQGVRDKGEVVAGRRVLILGAGGGVGTFAVQIAKALGAEVTGVCSTAKTELVRSIGADQVIDYTREDVGTGGKTYDVILDIAGRRPLPALRRALVPGGTLVLIGGEGGNRWVGGLDRMVGAFVASPFTRAGLRPMLATMRTADLRFLTDLVETGRLKPVVDRTFPLAEAAHALRYLHEGRPKGKVVLTV
jgi:NADPH:quinone reductase-like Zn-dependent oxidoreductase